MKPLITILLVIGFSAAGTFTTLKRADTVNAPASIDGSKSPEMIPDRVAYSLMLRLISSPRTETERRHIKAYIAQIGIESDADIIVLQAVAEQFSRQADIIDSEVKALKVKESQSNSRRAVATQNRLNQLREQLDSVTIDAIQSLRSRLSGNGLDRLQQFVNSRVKRNIRMRAESS